MFSVYSNPPAAVVNYTQTHSTLSLSSLHPSLCFSSRSSALRNGFLDLCMYVFVCSIAREGEGMARRHTLHRPPPRAPPFNNDTLPSLFLRVYMCVCVSSTVPSCCQEMRTASCPYSGAIAIASLDSIATTTPAY